MKTKCGDVCVHCTVMATVCIFCIICFYILCVHDFWTFWHHNLIFQYETQPTFQYFFSLWEFISGLLPQVEGGQSFTNKSQYSLKHTSLRGSDGADRVAGGTPRNFFRNTLRTEFPTSCHGGTVTHFGSPVLISSAVMAPFGKNFLKARLKNR